MSDFYYDHDWRRIGAITTVVVVTAFAVWLFLRENGGSDAALPGVVVATEVEPFGPELATGDDIKDAAARVGHPIYWAGRHQDGDLELTLTADGRAYVRYLTEGAAPGDGKADFLTVGTYRVDNAENALESVASRAGRESFDVPGGGLAVSDTAEPQRVYFTPAGSDLQIEVFDPEAGHARELVASGQIQPAG
jgi:hypothetical protein